MRQRVQAKPATLLVFVDLFLVSLNFNRTRYRSGSFSLFNVGSGVPLPALFFHTHFRKGSMVLWYACSHCLRSFSICTMHLWKASMVLWYTRIHCLRSSFQFFFQSPRALQKKRIMIFHAKSIINTYCMFSSAMHIALCAFHTVLHG